MATFKIHFQKESSFLTFHAQKEKNHLNISTRRYILSLQMLKSLFKEGNYVNMLKLTVFCVL